MNIKKIFILTHGEKGAGPNPGMTPLGHQQVQSLRRYLPATISRIMVGEGRRHFEMIKDLGLDFQLCEFSPMVGRATSGIPGPGKTKQVFLPHREIISIKQWLPIPIDETRRFIKPLDDKTVVLSGRPLIKTVLEFVRDLLNPPPALTASCYKIAIENSVITEIICHTANGAEAANWEEV